MLSYLRYGFLFCYRLRLQTAWNNKGCLKIGLLRNGKSESSLHFKNKVQAAFYG